MTLPESIKLNFIDAQLSYTLIFTPPVEAAPVPGYSKGGKELVYEIKVKDGENITAAHIHAGKKGVEGPPVVPIFGGTKKEGMFSGVLAKGTITDKNLVGPLAGKTLKDLVKMIEEGDAYVNVHTVAHPAGEIRGQIK